MSPIDHKLSSAELAFLVSASMNDYQQAFLTHLIRSNNTLADMMAAVDDHLDLLIEHRKALHDLSILGPLYRAARKMLDASQAFAEINATDAEVARKIVADIGIVAKGIAGDKKALEQLFL